MFYTVVVLDRQNGWKSVTLEQLKPYMTLDFVHHYKDLADPSKDKATQIKMRECADSDFNRNEWIQNIWGTLDYFKPYYCFDNTQDLFWSGGAATYKEPRGYLWMNFRECKRGDHCEKDPVKRRRFIRGLEILIHSYEE